MAATSKKSASGASADAVSPADAESLTDASPSAEVDSLGDVDFPASPEGEFDKEKANDLPKDNGDADDSVEPDELSKARAEVNELRDRLLRLQAEWDNFRKRTAQERIDEKTRASERLIEKLLPIVDDLERALEHSDSSVADGFVAGISAVQTKFADVLSKEGLKAIDPQGEPFDANLHSAVRTVENSDLDDDTVAEVYQKGYELGGKVLRPAMVAVTKH